MGNTLVVLMEARITEQPFRLSGTILKNWIEELMACIRVVRNPDSGIPEFRFIFHSGSGFRIPNFENMIPVPDSGFRKPKNDIPYNSGMHIELFLNEHFAFSF